MLAEPEKVSDNIALAVSSPEHFLSLIPSGIGNHAWDSLDAARMALRLHEGPNSPHNSLYISIKPNSSSSQSVSRLGINDLHGRTIHPDYTNVEIAISAARDPHRHLHVESKPEIGTTSARGRIAQDRIIW
ncbi:uncharacterized protein BT62DRAFT_1002746 [Guyanagaster necrorhizus]|uniref:Uncharacterized protein n=1 Tax=Guyanagaster necrorhizus TaxID=856835 RepID=A0A9P8AV48_9AGAR|nr:uncharacterized protein BT62DRAFT_1002746 [Guyanagaster necrorhizus MCA 3950]KAG7449164.1 hypothetical protein BT62DRAFT_1002746 [Guyanagaster necrorhizus MCA 3950]